MFGYVQLFLFKPNIVDKDVMNGTVNKYSPQNFSELISRRMIDETLLSLCEKI